MLTLSLCVPIAVTDWEGLSFFALLLGGLCLRIPFRCVCSVCAHCQQRHCSPILKGWRVLKIKEVKCPGWTVRVQWIMTTLHFDVLEVSYSSHFQIKSLFCLPDAGTEKMCFSFIRLGPKHVSYKPHKTEGFRSETRAQGEPLQVETYMLSRK